MDKLVKCHQHKDFTAPFLLPNAPGQPARRLQARPRRSLRKVSWVHAKATGYPACPPFCLFVFDRSIVPVSTLRRMGAASSESLSRAAFGAALSLGATSRVRKGTGGRQSGGKLPNLRSKGQPAVALCHCKPARHRGRWFGASTKSVPEGRNESWMMTPWQ